MKWNILIVDDEEDILNVSKLIFKNLSFDDKEFNIFSAKSIEEAKKLLNSQIEFAAIFLDVVFDNFDDGFKLTQYIREKLNNRLSRIIIRTGFSGKDDIKTLFEKYDISSYILKNETTSQKLKSELFSAINNYKDIIKINNFTLKDELPRKNFHNQYIIKFKHLFQVAKNRFLFNSFDIDSINFGFYLADIGTIDPKNQEIYLQISNFFHSKLINNSEKDKLLLPSELIAEFNNYIISISNNKTIFNFIYGVVDTIKNCITFVNAGITPGLIIFDNKNNESYIIGKNNNNIGVAEITSTNSIKIPNINDKQIFIITNGILDAINELNYASLKNSLLNNLENYINNKTFLDSFKKEYLQENVAIVKIYKK